MIYSSFVVLSRSYAGAAIFLFFLFGTRGTDTPPPTLCMRQWLISGRPICPWHGAGVFVPNWKKKDESLSKYEDFEAYKARTWLVLPYIY